MDEYLTSSKAARRLGVAPSSIKRWTQSGLLEFVITPGRHRRFTRQQLDDFARRHQDQLPARGAAQGEFVDALLSDKPLFAIQAAILGTRARVRSWYETAEALSSVPTEIGERWASGEITILEEHRCAERFARALSACAETIVTWPEAPIGLLAAAEGDDHTLALNLVELCLREAGWNVLWGGRDMPTVEIVQRVDAGGIGLVGLSASGFSSNAKSLAKQVRRLEPCCERAGAHLVLGGSGAWPSKIDGAFRTHRIERFSALHELLTGSQD